MKSSTQLRRKQAAVGAGSILLLAASLITASTFAGAQDGVFARCPADAVRFGAEAEFFGLDNYENHLLSGGPTSQTQAYDLAAGTYEIGAVSTDGYEFRTETSDQPNEQWFAEFIAADGSVLATSGVTGDLETGVETAFWSGSLGEVTLAEDAVAVRVTHAAIGASTPNSVRAVCVGTLSGGPSEEAPVEEPPAEEPTTEVEGIVEEVEEPAAIDPDLESSISINYDSTNIDPETITLICQDIDGFNEFTEGIGTGINADSAVDLVQDPVAPGSVCTVTFPSMSDHDCAMTVTPVGVEDLIVVEEDASKTITFPTTFEVDVFVDIFCTGPEPVTTEVQGIVEVAPEPVTTEVLNEVATAPVAQVTPGTPTFTG